MRRPAGRPSVAGLALIATCALLAALPRVLLLLCYSPEVAPDTLEYLHLARVIRTGAWDDHDGLRTPIYPIFMLMGRGDMRTIWAAQALLGLLSALALTRLVYLETRRLVLSCLSGLAPSLYLHSLFLEASIITETLATFLLLCSILLLRQALASPACARRALMLGVLLSLLCLTRPMFLYLIPLCALVLGLSGARRGALLSLLPALLLVGGWCGLNAATLGYPGPTTTTGLNLSNHSGAFIEHAPDEHRVIREIYLAHRARRMREAGTQSMTIFAALQDMRRATGLSLPALSRRLTAISLALFRQYPLLYGRSVLSSWVSFWKVSNYWRPQEIRSVPLRAALLLLWPVQKRIIQLVNLLFLASALYLTVRLVSRRASPEERAAACLCLLILCGSLVQALMERGENARYAVPFHPLILATVVLVGGRISRSWGSGRAAFGEGGILGGRPRRDAGDGGARQPGA